MPDIQVTFLKHRFEEAWVASFNTYPTNGVHLAYYTLEHGINMGFVQHIGLNSEQLDSWQREVIQRAFPNV